MEKYDNEGGLYPPPPDYNSCIAQIPLAPSESMEPMQIFLRTVENVETLYFKSITPLTFISRPTMTQVRDSREKTILSIMLGNTVGGGQNNRFVGCTQIMNAKGETLFVVSGSNGSKTLSCGDQILGVLEDKTFGEARLTARNAIGDVIFQGVADNGCGTEFCCCCCLSNPSVLNFEANGVPIARFQRSNSNTGGNELLLYNAQSMDPHIKALIIYAGYLAYLSFVVDSPCGPVGDRGLYKRFCGCIFIVALVLMSLPLLVLLR